MKEYVPIIDIAPLWRSDSDGQLRETVEAIDAACRQWGFFQVVNHGVPDTLIRRVWSETHRFFALEREVKLSISRTKENPRGYYDRELTKNARDLKEVFDFAKAPHPELPDDHPENRSAVDGYNRWPPALPEFKSSLVDYFAACERLGLKLLEAMCGGLGLPVDTLQSPFTAGHTSFVRLNYYPLDDPLDPAAAATTTDLGDMALHHHTDAGALTILLQDDVGGLQVQSGDEWVDVAPVDGAFVIYVGDMMQVWSNDHYPAALHRVRPIGGRARYSIPFFFNPTYDTDYAPLPSLAGERPRYRAINWGMFRQLRTDGDFADYGREVQITDYRID